MARTKLYEERSEKILLPIVEANGFELVDVEFVREAGTWYLRAYIDREGGITLDDCEVVSRAFSSKLDEEDFIEESYIMEVSSPGLTRPLKKEADFARSIGKAVEIHTYKPIDREKEFFGTLYAFDDKTVSIDDRGNIRSFDRSDIALIRLAFVFQDEEP